MVRAQSTKERAGSGMSRKDAFAYMRPREEITNRLGVWTMPRLDAPTSTYPGIPAGLRHLLGARRAAKPK